MYIPISEPGDECTVADQNKNPSGGEKKERKKDETADGAISPGSFSQQLHQTTAASRSVGKVTRGRRVHPEVARARLGRTAVKWRREELFPLLFPDQCALFGGECGSSWGGEGVRL